MEPLAEIQLLEFAEANPDDISVGIDPIESRVARRARMAEEYDDFEDETDENTDTTALLAVEKEETAFWTFKYYQKFFDVDTYEVLTRIRSSILPLPGRNFVQMYLNNNPDLYGPIWICATLLLTITLSGNLSNFLLHGGQPHYHYVPMYRKVSIAATAIYAYIWLVPLALWGFLSWRNSKLTNVLSYSFMEIVCVYGYSLFIYIPVSILWVVHPDIIRWVFMPFAMCQSMAVLMMAFWPAVKPYNRIIGILTLLVLMILHSLLAVGCGLYVFDHPEAEHVQPAVTNVTQGTPQSHE